MRRPGDGHLRLLTDVRIEKGQQLKLKPWDLAIVMEEQ